MSAVADRLHSYFCEETECDLRRMREVLSGDPGALDRLSLVRLYDDGSEKRLTPLLIAVECGHLSCVRLLLAAGADVTPPGTGGLDALSLAISRESYDLVECLIEHGVSPSRAFSSTPEYFSRLTFYVHEAACHSTPRMLQFLIDHGAATHDINYVQQTENMNHLMPTVSAIDWERPDNLKVLLLNGAIVDPDNANIEVTDEKHDALLLSLQLVVSYGDDLRRKMQIADVLHMFGVSFLRPSRLGPSPLAVLESEVLRDEARLFIGKTRARARPEMSPDQRAQLARHVRRLASSPLSLKAQCRLAVRRTRQLDVAELPRELTSYLLFQT